MRKLNLANGYVYAFAGTGTAGYSGDTGTALNATLDSPAGLVADVAGNLLIGDRDNDAVRKVWK